MNILHRTGLWPRADVPRCALTVAGLDPSGGAGVGLDIKAFALNGVYGAGVVTSITVQNTLGVQRVHNLPADLVADQLGSVLSDIRIDAAKTGMLGTKEIAKAVSGILKEHNPINLIVDPVLRAKDGTSLFEEDGIEVLKSELIPLALVVTVNLEEASALSELSVRDLDGMEQAARAIHRLGCKWVLVKGGHLDGDPVDLLFDGERFFTYKSERIRVNMHGTGCLLSACLAAEIAKGESVPEAVAKARGFVLAALKNAVAVGGGRPVAALAAGWEPVP